MTARSAQFGNRHHQPSNYGSGQTDQVSKLGIVVPPGASVFTFENSKSAPTLPHSTPNPPLPPKGTTMFDAPSASSALNSNQKRSANHQAGSNPLHIQARSSTLFSAASVVGSTSHEPLSSGQMSGNANGPSHKRVKATLPHLRPASGQPGPVPSGPTPDSGVRQPSQDGQKQEHPSGNIQLDRQSPHPQQSSDVIFASDVGIKMAAANEDGTTPTSGKVFLYRHPTIDGWVIWELQRNNGFVTRDDVRVFTDTFGIGSNKVLRRKAEDQNPPIITNNLLFPSMAAAEELSRLIVENKKLMDLINAPRFEEQNFKAQKIGGVDFWALRELRPMPKSVQKADQPLNKGNSPRDSQVVPEATNAAPSHKQGDDQMDKTIPPHKRSAKKALPIQNSETNELKSSASSHPTQTGTSGLPHQENSRSSLVDMTLPLNEDAITREPQAPSIPTRLIKIEADDKGKRPASEDLRDLTYDSTSSSARAEPANKYHSPEATRGLFQQSSRSSLNAAKPIDCTDAKASLSNTLSQQPGARFGHNPDTDYLDNHFGSENDAVQKAIDPIDDHNTTAEISKPDSNLSHETEQSAEVVLAPVPKTTRIQLHDVERMLPVRALSSASKSLMMGMTKGKYHGMIESAKGLCEACVEMELFPDRQIENATLLATWQALYQNPTFQSFSDDDKLNTVAVVYEKVFRGVTDSRMIYTIDQLLDLNGERSGSPNSDVHAFNAMVEEENYMAPRVITPSAPYDRQNIIRVAEKTAQYLKPPAPADDQAVTSPSPLNLPDTHNNPDRLTPPPDHSETREQQQVAGPLNPVFNDRPVQSPPLGTSAVSASGEVNTLGQKPNITRKAIEQDVQALPIKMDLQPEASSFPPQVPGDDASQQSQTPAKQEQTSFTHHLQTPSQTPSPLTPTQSSQVTSSRTGSQGLRNVLSNTRGIKHNLGAAGLLGSRWA